MDQGRILPAGTGGMMGIDDYVNQIIQGDCLEVMKGMPDDDRIVLITDPPYGINLDTSWLSSVHIQRGKPANKSDDRIKSDDDSLSFEWLQRYKRRLVWGFPYIPDNNATGWVVWDKQPGCDERGITAPVEVASTTLRRGYDVIRAMWGGYFRCDNEARYEHPTQKPIRVFKRPIEKFTNPNDIIFDPFVGSGSCLVAAIQTGRRYIGIELEPKYCEIARKRVAQAQEQQDLFRQPEEKLVQQVGLNI